MSWRPLLGALLVGAGVALQFVPLYAARLAPLEQRWPWLRILRWRVFQIPAGFGLIALGIRCLQWGET